MKNRVKIRFTIFIKKATNIPSSCGSAFISWRRGSKRHSGNTRIADVNAAREVIWDEKFVFETRFEYEGEANDRIHTEKLQERFLSLTLKMGKKTKKLFKSTHEELGKVELKLNNYVSCFVAKDEQFSIKMKDKKQDQVLLVFSIQATLLSIKKGTKVIPIEHESQAAALKATGIMQAEGQLFATTPDDQMSETTNDSEGDGDEDLDEEDVEDFKDDDNVPGTARRKNSAVPQRQGNQGTTSQEDSNQQANQARSTQPVSHDEKSTKGPDSIEPNSQTTSNVASSSSSSSSSTTNNSTPVSQPIPPATNAPLSDALKRKASIKTQSVVNTKVQQQQQPQAATPSTSLTQRPTHHKILAVFLVLLVIFLLRSLLSGDDSE